MSGQPPRIEEQIETNHGRPLKKETDVELSFDSIEFLDSIFNERSEETTIPLNAFSLLHQLLYFSAPRDETIEIPFSDFTGAPLELFILTEILNYRPYQEHRNFLRRLTLAFDGLPPEKQEENLVGEVLYQIGLIALLVLQDYDFAEECFKKILVFEDFQLLGLFFLNMLYVSQGEWERLATFYQEWSGKVESELKDVLRLKTAWLHLTRIPNINKVGQVLQQFDDSDDLLVLETQMELYRLTEDWQALHQALSSRLLRAKDRAEKAALLIELADIEHGTFLQEDRALAHYREALDSPIDGYLVHNLKRIVSSQNIEQIISIAQASFFHLTDTPSKATHLVYLAERIAGHPDIQDIRKSLYRSALELQPQNAFAGSRYEELLFVNKDWKELISHLQRKIENLEETEGWMWQLRIIGDLMPLIQADSYGEGLPGTVSDLFDPYWLLKRKQRWARHSKRWGLLSELLQEEIDILSGEDGAPESFLRHAMIIRAFLLFRHQGHLQEAEQLLLKVLSAEGDNLQVIAGLVEIQVLKEGLSHIPAEMQRAVEGLPDSPQKGKLFSVVGLLQQHRLNDVESAIDHYEKALACGYQDTEILSSMKSLYSEKHNWERVVDIVDRQLEVHDDKRTRARLAFEKGEILQFRLQREDFVVAYAHAVSYDPKSLKYVVALGRIYETTKEWDKLIALNKRFLRKYSRDTHLDPDIEYKLSLKIAQIYEDQFNDIYLAMRTYTQILESHPDRTEVAERVQLLKERDRAMHAEIDKLKDELGRTSLASEVVELNARIGTILYTHGDLNQAAKYFHENRTLDKSHTDSLHLLQEVYERTKKWKELKDVYEAELQQVNDNDRRLYLLKKLGELNEKHIGDIQATFEHYEQALQIDPKDIEIIKALQQIYSDVHRWKKYVEYLRREAALTDDPATLIPLLHEMGATLYEKLGRTDDAIRCFTQLLTFDRKHLRSLNVLEKIYKKNQRWKELTDILATKAQLITDPVSRSKIYQGLGRYFEDKLHNSRLALENYIVSFLCNKNNSNAFKALERLYQEQQNWEDILGIYETAIEEAEKSGSPRYNLEDLYVKKGQVELFHLGYFQEAIESFRRGLSINTLNETCFGSLKTIFLQHKEWDQLFDLFESRALHESSDVKKIALYYEMAELCETRLRSKNMATDYYQRILELDRFQEKAFQALDKHYQSLHRWEELVRLYQLRLTVARNGEDVLYFNQKISAIYEKKLREFEKAIYYARKMLMVAPANSTALRILSRLYELNKMWDELIEISLREVKITTDMKEKAYVFFRIGSLIETQIKDDEEAIKYYREAIKCDEKCFPALHGIREIYYRKGQWDKVIVYLHQENSLWEGAKEKSSILFRIGQIYLEQLGERSLAIESFEKAIETHEENAVALQALLNLYFEDKRWEKAVEVARTLTENAAESLSEPQKAEAFFKRGVVARHLNFLFEAADSFKIALEFAPDHPDALRSLAELYVSKKVDTAFHELFHRLEKTFVEGEQTEDLARLYRYRGLAAESDHQLEEARNYYSEALRIQQHGVEFLFSLVNFYIKLRNFDDAINVVSDFIQQGGAREDMVKCYSLLARIFGDFLENHLEAIACYRELLRLNPHDTSALFKIAQHYYVLGEFDEALITINQVIERAKTHGTEDQQSLYYFYLGRIMEAGFGDESISLEYYLQARDLDRKNIQAIVAAARLYQSTRDWKNFEKLFRTTVPVMGRKLAQEVQIPLRLFFAEGFIAKGDYSIAAEEYEMILSMDRNHIDTHIALSALALEHLGNVEQALQHLTAVTEQDVTLLKAYHKIARTYRMQSFTDKAFAVYKLLDFYGSTRPGEMAYIREHQGRVIERRINPLKTITPEVYTGSVRQTDEKTNIFHELWETLSEYLVQNFLLSSFDPPLPRREAISLKSNKNLKSLLEHVYQLLALDEVEIYVRNHAEADISLEKNMKWGIILSSDFLTDKYTTNEQIFLLGRMFATLLEPHHVLLKLTRDELDGLYQLMLDIVQTYLEDKAGFSVKFVRMPKRMVTKLETILEKYDIKEIDKLKLPDFHRVVENADQTRSRVGHIISGDITASLTALMKVEGMLSAGEDSQDRRIAAVRDSRHMQDLIRFHTSENHFFVRSFLGISI